MDYSPSPEHNHRGSRFGYLEQDNQTQRLVTRLDFGEDQPSLDKDEKPIVQ